MLDGRMRAGKTNNTPAKSIHHLDEKEGRNKKKESRGNEKKKGEKSGKKKGKQVIQDFQVHTVRRSFTADHRSQAGAAESKRK